MTEANRKSTAGAVEQIMRNMTSDIHNVDGQYRQLEGWNGPAQNAYMNPYNMCNNEPQMPYQSNQPPMYNCSNHYPQQFDNGLGENDLYGDYNIYSTLQNGMSVQDVNNLYTHDYKYVPNIYHQHSAQEGAYMVNRQDVNILLSNTNIKNRQPIVNKRPLIDNLVGNWTPNTSGTYSPFGNVVTTNVSNIFEHNINSLNNINMEQKYNQDRLEKPSEDVINFSFNRDNKKPRIVAEVKPMRPTYSDVLLKTVPNTNNNNNKSIKNDIKDVKSKVSNGKKNTKNEKSQKNLHVTLNRTNTNHEIKDVSFEKANHQTKTAEKMKENKPGQLNRKWVSLDNMSEFFGDLKTGISDAKNKKNEETIVNKSVSKNNQRKSSKNQPDQVDTDSGGNIKTEITSVNKNTVKRESKRGMKQKNHDQSGNNEKTPNKRNQRNRRRDEPQPLDIIKEHLKLYVERWWKFCFGFVLWLWNLVSDVFGMSLQILHDGVCNIWSWSVVYWSIFRDTASYHLKQLHVIAWFHEKFKKNKGKSNRRFVSRSSLEYNMNMPMTGDEAMKRLLACKGKDPYSILGVTPNCTDDDIKRYYKKQAVLVHPDKNKQLGAEEAFKILVHAFDMIGEPERRAAYDKELAHVEQAWTELTELLRQFQQKVEAASKTIRCSYCGSGHGRVKVDRPIFAARNCNSCKIYHSAREGDIWAEAKYFGFVWRYYACMEGAVYDITKWAGCQKNSLKQLKPDSHNVQYRIAQGKYASTSYKKNGAAGPGNGSNGRGDEPTPNIEELLNKFYGQMDATPQGVRRKANKKSK